MLYAIMIGWLAVSTGGIEAGIALHVAWNVILTVLMCLAVVVFGVEIPDGANMSGVGWQPSIVHLLGTAGYILAVGVTARRRIARGVQTRLAASGPEPAQDADAALPRYPAPQSTGASAAAHDAEPTAGLPRVALAESSDTPTR
jgi:hypothetical protein